ncbi:MAG: hypothetical protein BWY44_01483 [Candidatus Omnitrophica bacterium ADurb.Bin292]|nr:MAG: hypothetical protein BWY44_01483 [Candidatus Omnitrophica bacterium ADurb.Bin292]
MAHFKNQRGHDPKKQETVLREGSHLKFLPTSSKDFEARGWEACDIILVTGDAYVDHPAYGTALIGRVLESAGYKVGVIAQPDWRTDHDFLKLGRPRLFFGISSGNLDSMVANYTASKKPRRNDEYSPGGRGGLRPNRATIVYTSKIKGLFPGVPVVIGGIEASLRRLVHYDYWEDHVRRSILLDSKADILVYGMAERQMSEIARRLNRADPICKLKETASLLNNIPGTVIVRSKNSLPAECRQDKSRVPSGDKVVEVPSYEEVVADKDQFNLAFKLAYQESDPVRGKTILQKHGDRFIVQYPPAHPLSTKELDSVYELPFAYSWHPVYDRQGGVPGFETTRFSITSHRGCSSECSFCSLYAHQGRIIQSRSKESILAEVRRMASRPDFRGTVTDIGGPTANLYGAECGLWESAGACRLRQCMMPEKCQQLKLGYEKTIDLWRAVMKVPGVRHLFIQSGLRYDLLIEKESDRYLQELCADHVSGQLKVAPEHVADRVLALMNKPGFEKYKKFAERFENFSRKSGKKQYLVNYWISSHPGAGGHEAKKLAEYFNRKGIHPEQIQDFLPLPATISGAMYWTGKHPMTGIPVFVARSYKEREAQRNLVQPSSRKMGYGKRQTKRTRHVLFPVSRRPKKRNEHDTI